MSEDFAERERERESRDTFCLTRILMYERTVDGLRIGSHHRLLTTSQSALAAVLKVALLEQQTTGVHSLSPVRSKIQASSFEHTWVDWQRNLSSSGQTIAVAGDRVGIIFPRCTGTTLIFRSYRRSEPMRES